MAKDYTATTLDFSYYYMGNYGLRAVLDVIKVDYFHNTRILDFSANNLTDTGL